ncbi:MAG: FAD-dependent oxidoreductase [Thermoguttaceae bacterium]|jgi:phytoene dehydrogenase-like protein
MSQRRRPDSAEGGQPAGKEARPAPAPAAPITRRDFINGTLAGTLGLSAGTLLGGAACGADGEARGDGPHLREAGRRAVRHRGLVPSCPPHDKGDSYHLCHGLARGRRWSIPPASGNLLDCIVIGGGISGLAAAWRLRKLEHDHILVLEKNDAAGGYCRQEQSGGQTYSIAAAYTEYPDTPALVELYTDLGVVTGTDAQGDPVVADRYLPKSTDSKDYLQGAWYDDAWDSGFDNLPLPKKLRADLRAFRNDLDRWNNYVGSDGKEAFAKPTDASTADAVVRDLDNLTLREYIVKSGWDPKVSEFFDSFVRSSMGSTHDRISAWAALSFLVGEFNFRSGSDPAAGQATNILTQPGGNGYLSRLLAEHVGADRIRTRAFVFQARNAGDEVQVTCLEEGRPKTLRARTAIYAAPRYLAPRVLPDLPAAGRRQVQAFHYTPYIVANVHVSRTPLPGMWNGLVHGDFFLSDFVVADWPGLADAEHASPARPNVLTVYAPLVMPDQRRELLACPAECYQQRILDDLERLLPGVRATVTGFDLYRWGHAMLAADKGFIFSPARRDAARPLGRVFFAGHDVEGLPAFENAVTSAVRAAGEAHAAMAS